MLKFEFYLPKRSKGFDVKKYTVDELFVKIYGNFKIYDSDRLFFEEPELCIFEFVTDLNYWIKNTPLKNYYYYSLEHHEPIFSFLDMGEKKWYIDSVWKKMDAIIVDEDELIKSIICFIKNFEIDLSKEYKIELSEKKYNKNIEGKKYFIEKRESQKI